MYSLDDVTSPIAIGDRDRFPTAKDEKILHRGDVKNSFRVEADSIHDGMKENAAPICTRSRSLRLITFTPFAATWKASA